MLSSQEACFSVCEKARPKKREVNQHPGDKVGIRSNSSFHLKERGRIRIGFIRGTRGLNEASPCCVSPAVSQGVPQCSVLRPSHFFLPFILLSSACLVLGLLACDSRGLQTVDIQPHSQVSLCCLPAHGKPFIT